MRNTKMEIPETLPPNSALREFDGWRFPKDWDIPGGLRPLCGKLGDEWCLRPFETGGWINSVRPEWRIIRVVGEWHEIDVVPRKWRAKVDGEILVYDSRSGSPVDESEFEGLSVPELKGLLDETARVWLAEESYED